MKNTRKPCRWYPVCPMKRFYEEGKIDRRWVEDYCWVDNPDCIRKQMEARGEYHPDNMLPDGTIGKSLD
ncbi:MAG: hypothetical protein K9L68_00335 [Spirochaetales bacterium]|nr:hypothetical protein [Spirochaetales bacterium]MCF7937024.1 hypothetical protein [Spirochaetales bacterium]